MPRVLLAYLDESYRKGSEYWLGAALVHESKVHALSRDIRACRRRIPVEFDVPVGVELHGYDIFHGEKDFEPIKEAGKIRVLTGLFKAGINALARSGPDLFFVGVEWSHDPGVGLEAHRMYAFEHLIPLLEEHSRGRGERCLLIADREETTESAVRDAVHQHQESTHGEHNDCWIIENAMFVASHDSPGVQATDLATFCFQRRRASVDKDPRAQAALDRCWKAIEPAVRETILVSAPATLEAGRPHMHEEPRKGGSTAR